jgi:hypothetical protein
MPQQHHHGPPDDRTSPGDGGATPGARDDREPPVPVPGGMRSNQNHDQQNTREVVQKPLQA